jgi:GNAT superfamily N-acetyltransferase
MTTADLPLGMRLKEQAGWNQIEADWRRALALEPDGCVVAELDGRPVGTTTTCVFGPVAWVAMVLVDAAVRGRGVGTALMRHALAFLDGRGIRSVRLDATPLGRPLYEKLGFVAQFELTRYAGMPSAVSAVEALDQPQPADLGAVLALDRHVTGTDRSQLLRHLFAERPDDLRLARHGDRIEGFITARPGATAVMIGPCVGSARAGPRLLAGAWLAHQGQRVFFDVPIANRPAVQLAEAHSFTVQRPLLRMGRGELIHERVEELWASFGPEKG